MNGLFGQAGDGEGMSFKEHLKELRNRLMRIMLALVVGFFICWEFRLPLFDFLSGPIAGALADNGIYQFRALQLTESVVVYLKTALLADFFLLSPYIFYELWGFVSPGLYSKEKKFVLPLTAFSVFFFVVGAGFAYLILLPFITDWLVALTLEGGHVDVLITIANTYSFAFMFLLMFGLVFELPLVIFFLALWGTVDGRGLLKFWRYFVVISFVLSGVLTPPDPLSQIFMAVPLNALYGFGVIIAFAVSRARAKDADNAGNRALKSMALALFVAVAVIAGGLVLIQGLPQKSLSDLAPTDTAVAIGFNPRVLMEERSVAGLLRSDPKLGPVLDAMDAAGFDFTQMTDGLWVGTAKEAEGVLLRGQNATELAAAVKAKMSPAFAKISVVALDDDTLAIGDPAFIAAVLDGEIDSLDGDSDEVRLLRRLTRSGPAWVWLPGKSPLRPLLLGTTSEEALGAVGASLSLTAPRQLLIDVPLSSDIRSTGTGDRVTARIEAARVMSLANASTDRDDEIVGILKTLTQEMATLAPASRTPALTALSSRLEALAKPAQTSADGFPPLVMLASHLRGVSVRLDDNRIHVTSEIADSALGAFIKAIVSGHLIRDMAPVEKTE